MSSFRADLAALRAKVAAMTEGLMYHDDLGWLAGEAADGEIYTVASLSLDTTASGRCYNAKANGAGIVALRNLAPAYLAALERIVETMDADESDPFATIDEIRAVLAGAGEAMRPGLFRALLKVIVSPLHEPPPPTPEEFARNIVEVVGRQPAGMRAVMADSFGAMMADNIATAYRPDGLP